MVDVPAVHRQVRERGQQQCGLGSHPGVVAPHEAATRAPLPHHAPPARRAVGHGLAVSHGCGVHRTRRGESLV